MRCEWESEEVTMPIHCGYDDDGHPLFEESITLQDFINYYDHTGTLLGSSYSEEPLAFSMSDKTEKKLSSILMQADIVFTGEKKWELCCNLSDVFLEAEEQIILGDAIINKPALKQLVNAFEALTVWEQEVLTGKNPGGPNHRSLSNRDPNEFCLIKNAKRYLNKEQEVSLCTFQEIINNLCQEVKKFLASMGLQPEGKDEKLFEDIMSVLSEDPSFKRREGDWQKKEAEVLASCKEKMPDYVTGLQTAAGRSRGKRETQEKADQRHHKILAEANRLDPEKTQSAFSLSDQLSRHFKINRRRITAKLSTGEPLSTTDASYNRYGFKKSTVYRVLKASGWK